MPEPYLLLVEDNLADAVLVRQAIQTLGWEVEFEHVMTGDEGIKQLVSAVVRDTPPERILVLLDINLPGIGGLDVLRQFKQHPTTRRIPVVVYTSSDDPGLVGEALDRHANLVLRKLLDLDQHLDQLAQVAVAFLGHSDSATAPLFCAPPAKATTEMKH